MTAAGIPSDSAHQQQFAFRWWARVQRKPRNFTVDVALDVIKSLWPVAGNQPKDLAKRLRQALELRGVAVKHTWALTAAAQLLGYQSWHACPEQDSRGVLQLLQMSDACEELLPNWLAVARRLCACCDAWQRENPTKLFQLHFGSRFVLIQAPAEVEDSSGRTKESLPIAIVSPVGKTNDWLKDAPAAFEMVRRHLEESRKAILDGVAILTLCDRPVPPEVPPIPQRVTASDAFNSELVLLREDNPLQPGSGYEIARGDEMTCWSQLVLATEGDKTEVRVDEDSWRIGEGRYVWQLITIHPNDYIPGQVVYSLNEGDVKKLLRRYRLAKSIFAEILDHHVVVKKLDYLSGPTDLIRVDLRKLLLHMHKAGLSWESYCTETDQQMEMTPQLPGGFVLSLIERLHPEDPNAFFARPTRAELLCVRDDSLLRTIIPRVDHLRYRVRPDLPDDIKEVVQEAIADLSASMQLQKLTAVGNIVSAARPLPYLVYAGDGEELRLKLEEHNLVMFAGVMPYLVSMEGLVKQQTNLCPFAFGHSLYLDIDREEAQP